MTDIFGPADAAGALVARPVDGRAFPAADTWFGDCSSPNAADGTDIEAAWLNSVIANLRAVVRSSGIVTEDNSDIMLLRGVQYLMQGAAPIYAATAGTASAYTATLAPAPPSYAAVRSVIILPHASNTGPATINFNGLGALPLTFGGVTALPAGILLAGVPTVVMISGGAAHIGGGRAGRVNLVAMLSTASYTTPAGCRSQEYEMWGSGAGGGGASNGAASGGTGGGYVRGTRDATPGEIIPCTVATGGAYGNASGGTAADGGNGGTTSLGAIASATGGVGGKAAVSGALGAAVGTAGSGSGGAIVIPGSPSGGGMVVGDVGGGSRYIGSPGGAAFGGAPIGQITGTTGAHAAKYPGGGGGGGGGPSAVIGALGANGLILIKEYY